MSERDEAAAINRKHWERMVRERCGYTIPWLDLDVEAYRAYREGETTVLPRPYCDDPVAKRIMEGLPGRDALCLALGGGQQSAVFALLGARVTVVDLAEGQVEGDRKAAAHYGYEVTAIRADMRDLSCLADDSFDVVSGTALCYIPEIREVYAEVARVLRPGGLYRLDAMQPALHFVAWNGEAYCITRPYAERICRSDSGAIEFRHDMGDIFNGLLEHGFAIEYVQDTPLDLSLDPEAKPGSWSHERVYVAGGFEIVARRK